MLNNGTTTPTLLILYNFVILDIKIFNFKQCVNNCSNQGSCSLGTCFCNDNYYGEYCENKKCLNSLCYYNNKSYGSLSCTHCSGNGMYNIISYKIK